MKSPYYINLNGHYGNRTQDYLTLRDLLAHMDRLGIGQTTAVCMSGNVVMSNRQLAQDLQENPDIRDRIIPVFLAEPSMAVMEYERRYLEECLKTFRPACLELLPRSKGFRLTEMEWVLRDLAEPVSVIFVNMREELCDEPQRMDDLVCLANRFPAIKFVIQQVFWQPLHSVIDAMRRAENICLDTSWIHGRDQIALLHRLFGSDRLVFSTAFRSDSGAAMAGLSWANLPQEEKNKIACDSFIRLFSDPEDRRILMENRRSLPDHVKNSFWSAFLEERPIRGVKIIDAHTHLGPHGHAWLSPTDETAEQAKILLSDFEKFGISAAVSSNTARAYRDPIGANLELLEATAIDHTRLKGYLTYIPVFSECYTEEFLDRMMRSGYFIGLKTLPSYMDTDIADPRYTPMFRYADAHHLPILIHTWEGKYGTAGSCIREAAKWPNAKLILGHSGGGDEGRRQCEEAAESGAYPNVYYEFCGSFTSRIRWEDTLEKIDYRRVLYGTDTFLHDIAWELGRLLSTDIPDEKLKAILGMNAERVLGL